MRLSLALLLLISAASALGQTWTITDIDVDSIRPVENPSETVLYPGERNLRFTFQGPVTGWTIGVSDIRFLIAEVDPDGSTRESVFPESRVTTIPIGPNLRVAWVLDLPDTQVVSQVPHAVRQPLAPQTLADTLRVIERLDFTPIITSNGSEVSRLPVISFQVQQPPPLTISPTGSPLGGSQVFTISIPNTYPSFASSESLSVLLFHPQDLSIGKFGDVETLPLDGCTDGS